MSKQRLIIFDTTLRDGEQSPGASMTQEEKIRIALMLEKMQVDVIEAGFPIASPGDFESVKAIAQIVKDSTICGLARALDKDIDRAGEVVRISQCGAYSYLYCYFTDSYAKQVAYDADEVVAQAVYAVKRARNLIDDVEFSCEDAGRSEFDFMSHY